MKQLLIMRHAKSDWSHPELGDHDRPLNKRGLRNAPAMGDWLISQELEPELVISSTAHRAKQTTELMTSQFDTSIPTQYDSDLYHASLDTWLTTIPIYAESESTILIVGHNPGLERLVYDLTGEYHALPTATITYLRLQTDDWSEIGSAPVKHVEVWRPKEIGVE